MRKIARTFFLLALVAVALVLFVSAGSREAQVGKGQDVGTLVVGMPGDPRSLDPQRTNDQPSARVMKQIYDTLM